MGTESLLDRLHCRMKSIPALHHFAEINRVLLSVGFFAPGLSKLLGLRFTRLPVEDPIGFFFEALYRAGLYWRFLGGTQVLASVLVLVPEIAHLGAILFLIILSNILIITFSLPFGGTPWVVLMMLLASVYLVFWDYPRWKTLLPVKFESPVLVPEMPQSSKTARRGYLLVALGGWSITLVFRGLCGGLSMSAIRIGTIVASSGGILLLWDWFRGNRLPNLAILPTRARAERP